MSKVDLDLGNESGVKGPAPHVPTPAFLRPANTSHILSMSQPSGSVSVPQAPATTSTSNIERIFDDALKSYKKKIKKDLKNHFLFEQLEKCDSPASILAILRAALFDPSQTGNHIMLEIWLAPTLNVLCAFSDTLDKGVSLAFPPAKTIAAGAGVLLLAAKDVYEGRDVLIDIFARIESFFQRLEIYVTVSLTPQMTNKMVQITVETLDILATVTKEMKQSITKKFLKRVLGRTDLEDGIKKLDKLTNEEAMMANAHLLITFHNHTDSNVLIVKSEAQPVNDDMKVVDDKVPTIADDGKATAKEVRGIQTADGAGDMKRS